MTAVVDEEVGLGRAAVLQRAHEPRPARVGRRLLLGDAALVDEALHERVVAGEADERAVAEHVGARIADVRDADARAVDQERHHRRARAAQLRVVLSERGEPGGGLVERGAEFGGEVDVG